VFSSVVLLAGLTTIVVAAPRAALTLEVAQTEVQREYGLMNRRALPAHSGMIFVFDSDAPIAFWMKDTLVPLDMVFVASDGTVRRVFERVAVVSPALPDDRIPREAGVARYVIELPAGEASSDGITAGVKLDLHGVPAPL
jgi:uncharacterized protein